MAESMERGAWDANACTRGGKLSSAARRGMEKPPWVLVLEAVSVLHPSTVAAHAWQETTSHVSQRKYL